MNCQLSVTIPVSKYAFDTLIRMAKQNDIVNFTLDKKTREITLSANMHDFPDFSSDGGWDEVNDFLEGVE